MHQNLEGFRVAGLGPPGEVLASSKGMSLKVTEPCSKLWLFV